MAAEAEDGGEVVTTDDGEVHGAIADLERDAASANLSEQVAALEEECAQRAKAELALLAELQSRCDVHIAVQVRCDAAKSAASAAEREAEQLEAELTEVRSRADAALRFDDGDATARSLMDEVSAFEAHIASGAAEAGAHDAARVELQGEIATLRALVCALGGDDRHDEAAPEPPRAEPTAEMAAAALAVPARALHLLATDPCADETFDAVSTSVDVIEWQAHSILHGWSGMRSQMPPRLSRMRLGSVSASLAASAAESADAGDAGEESASAGDDLPSSGATPAAADANAFTWKRAAPTTFTDVLATRLVELDLVSPGPGSEWLSSWKTTPKPSAMGARALASAGAAAVGGDAADARASGRATTKNAGAIDDGSSESAAKQKAGDEPIEEPLDEEAWRYGESVEHILSELAREVRDGSPPVTRVMRRGLRCRLWTRSAALDPQRTPALGELAGAALEMHRRRAALTLIASELGERVLSMQASLAVAEDAAATVTRLEADLESTNEHAAASEAKAKALKAALVELENESKIARALGTSTSPEDGDAPPDGMLPAAAARMLDAAPPVSQLFGGERPRTDDEGVGADDESQRRRGFSAEEVSLSFLAPGQVPLRETRHIPGEERDAYDVGHRRELATSTDAGDREDDERVVVSDEVKL